MSWKRFTTTSISIIFLLVSEQLLHACADFDYYDSYASFFGNKATQNMAYKPFFYIDGDLYYDNYYNKDNVDFDNILLIKEWQQNTDQSIPLADIDSLLNKFSLQDIEMIANKKSHKNNSQKVVQNSFAQWLIKGKHDDITTYLQYAKTCELNAGYVSNPWDTATAKALFTNQQLIEKGLEIMPKVKGEFLRMKYIFQIMRMAFYDHQYDYVLKLYEKWINGNEDKSIACTRCIGFKAGAYYHLNDKATAGYLYSKMFDNNDAYKMDAMVSYTWSKSGDDNDRSYGKKNSAAIYQKAQNNHEKAVLKIMDGLRAYDKGLSFAQEAYALDPQVKGLDILINREINKIEERYYSSVVYDENKLSAADALYLNLRYLDYGRSVAQKAKDSLNKIYVPYLHAIRQFNNKLIADGKNKPQEAFWHLSSAYIAYMLNDKETLKNEMQMATHAGMQFEQQRLYKVLDILKDLKRSPQITAALEAELLPKLQELNTYARHSYTASHNFRDIMQNLVAGKYLRQQDTSKAIYAMAHSESYDSTRTQFYASDVYQDLQGLLLDRMSIPSLKKVQQFYAKNDKTPFEQWLIKGTLYDVNTLQELEGTKYLRAYNFDKATQIFATLPQAEKYINPFLPRILDIMESEPKDSINTYTKYSFSKRMAELQKIIAKNPKDAGALYGYAVALYNISYYGKSGNIFAYFRSSVDENAYYKSEGWEQLTRPFQEYYGVYTAEQYFNKASIATNDLELKAKCIFGAAKCWQKRCSWPEQKYYDPKKPDPYYNYSLQNPYFKKLNTELSNTNYAENVAQRCDYFSDYIKL